MAIDGNKLQALVDKMFGDVGAAMGSALVLLGDKFGFYKKLASDGPLTAAELAAKTGTVERYVREWTAQQAAAGYIDYDAKSGRFSISPEQALLLADETGPAFFPAMYEIVAATLRDEPKVANAFRNGGGVGWHEHDACLFSGTERFFRRAIQCTWCPNGFPHSTASARSWSAARASRTSDAATACR